MKTLIKQLLRENIEGKMISVDYLRQLRNNLTNYSGIKYVKSWIMRGTDGMVKLSPKEIVILRLIERGGPNPSDFGTKN
jgi:hypothetical protein